MTTITIHITKEILEMSAKCGRLPGGPAIGENCAFALAVRDLFPFAWVSQNFIYPKNGDTKVLFQNREKMFPISKSMTRFIEEFDTASVIERVAMPEQSFDLEIPDWALEGIDISDVFEKSKTLSFSTVI